MPPCNVSMSEHPKGNAPSQHCSAAGELQTSLQREQVLWKKGLLVIPAIVYDLLNTIMVSKT